MNSDGCTMPSFLKKAMKAKENFECCKQHDFDRRNTSIPNKTADWNLKKCIEKKYPIRSWIYWVAVRLANPFYKN